MASRAPALPTFALATPDYQLFEGIALQGDNRTLECGFAHVPENASALDVIAARLDNDLLFADGFE
jgi:hypothetical protein